MKKLRPVFSILTVVMLIFGILYNPINAETAEPANPEDELIIIDKEFEELSESSEVEPITSVHDGTVSNDEEGV